MSKKILSIKWLLPAPQTFTLSMKFSIFSSHQIYKINIFLWNSKNWVFQLNKTLFKNIGSIFTIHIIAMFLLCWLVETFKLYLDDHPIWYNTQLPNFFGDEDMNLLTTTLKFKSSLISIFTILSKYCPRLI